MGSVKTAEVKADAWLAKEVAHHPYGPRLVDGEVTLDAQPVVAGLTPASMRPGDRRSTWPCDRTGFAQVFGMRAALLILASAGCQSVFGLDPPRLRDASPLDVDDAPADSMLDDVPASPLALTYVTEVESAVDASSFTFNGVAIGTPSPDRHVVVVAHSRSPSGGYFSNATLTFDGAAMTKVVAMGEGTEAAITVVFIAAVPTGSTATFQLSYTGGASDRRAALGVWVVRGLASALPYDTATFNGLEPGMLQLDIPVGGFALAGVSMSTTPGGTTGAWTGATAAYGHLLEASWISGATNSTASGTVQVTHNCTDTATSQIIAGASWR